MKYGRVFFPAVLVGVVAGVAFGPQLKSSIGTMATRAASGAPAAAASPSAAEQPQAGAALPVRDLAGPAAPRQFDQDERSTIDLFKRSQGSVAFLTTTEQRVDMWSRTVSQQATGTGSGFVWDRLGHIVTNYHVVQPVAERRGGEVLVTLGDQNYPGVIAGVAPELDLAVVKIKAPADKLQPVPVGTSSNLEVGQKVFAIGNPFGLDHTLTTGIVSALGRTITSVSNSPIEGVIQTDAAINPGNSGGPLLDSAGRLIGVNTAIYSPSGANAGIGFAVPVDTVSRVVPQLIEFGSVRRPRIGITLDERLDNLVARRFGVQGAVIATVADNGAAARAGLRGVEVTRESIIIGDVITEIDGKPVNSQSELAGRLSYIEPGTTVAVKVWRDGKTRDVRLTLGASR